MKLTATLLLLFTLTGCAYFTPYITETDAKGVTTRYTQDAYAQKVISEQATCDVKLSDLDAGTQRDLMLMAAMGRDINLCGNTRGRNYFDAKTEVANSRHKMLSGVAGAVAKVAGVGLIAGAVESSVEAIAKNAGDRNTTVGNVSVDSGVTVGSSSNDPSTSGELASGGATANTTNTIDNNPEVNLIIGRDNDLLETVTSDNARAYIDSEQVQQTETSASAVQTSQAVTDDITNAEELNNDDNSTRDE